MAILQRHLGPLLIGLLGLAAGTSAGLSQQPDGQPVTFRVIAIGNNVSNLLYDLSPGKPVAICAGGSGLSEPYASPASGQISFYRTMPAKAPGEKPRKVRVAEATLGKGGPYLVALAVSSSDILKASILVADDSWTAHPMQTIRVFNFSRRRAALQINTERLELTPAENHIFSYPDGKGSVSFKAAFWEEGKWILRTNCAQGVIPNTRSTIIITDVPPTPEVPDPVDINLSNVFDFSKPPPVQAHR